MLRAALAAAVDEGLLPRSPATRVGLPTADRRRENFDRQAADVVVAFVAGA